jgi:hypothetical protein
MNRHSNVRFRETPPLEVLQKLTRPFFLTFPCNRIQELPTSSINFRVRNYQEFFDTIPILKTYYYPSTSPDFDSIIRDKQGHILSILTILRQVIRAHGYKILSKNHFCGHGRQDRIMVIIPPPTEIPTRTTATATTATTTTTTMISSTDASGNQILVPLQEIFPGAIALDSD